MRQIKFRGYSPARKEWVYGSLLLNATVTFIIGDHGGVDVIPESVGQFTGLHDKNGVEIYEGDVVEIGYDRSVYTIVWNKYMFIGKRDDGDYTVSRIVSLTTVLRPSFTHPSPQMRRYERDTNVI